MASVAERSETPILRSYRAARARFREAARSAGWVVSSHPVGATGPDGDELTIDVAQSVPERCSRLLLVSSGLHGVEGPFGSAVQSLALDRWPTVVARAQAPGASVGVVFLHALNPFGFAWSRRTDADNIDLNRNFIAPGEPYRMDSPLYERFDSLLNPRCPPSALDGFPIRMLGAMALYGRAALKQALVTGQYTHERGLFYGGERPSATALWLREHAPSWLAGRRLVAHLDLHTGLGRFATHKVLVNHDLPGSDRDLVRKWFGADRVEAGDPETTSYRARGHFGQFAARLDEPDRRYLYLCAEFGTYGNLRVLAGLRAENQAHFWTSPDAPVARRAKARLQELFCPAAPAWRRQVLPDALELIERAFASLAHEPIG